MDAKVQLYWVAVLELPKKISKDEVEGTPRLIGEAKLLLARNEQDAALKFALSADLKDVDKDRVEVFVRPF